MPVRGDKQVAAALRALSRGVDVPLNAASRHALAPTLSAAKRNARTSDFSDSSGALAKSLVIKKNAARSRKLAPVHQVGPRRDVSVTHTAKFSGKKQIRRPVKYAHLVEFGTAPHFVRPGFFHPGAKAKPFMTPAYYETRAMVSTRFMSRIGPEMEKRAAGMARRAR